MPSENPNIYGLDVEGLAGLPALAGQPPYRPKQIANWLYNQGVTSFDEMTNLSKPLRESLTQSLRIDRIEIAESQIASDDSATKYLFKLEDDHSIEAVWIREEDRDTHCISSQVGCAYGCTFCATASMHAGRNLTAGEILGQVAALRSEAAKRNTTDPGNLVFMGMGEPLANYDQLMQAIRLVCGDPGFELSPKRIVISTVGLVPEIRRLAQEPLAVRLAFSLNAPTDEQRDELMPVNKKYPFTKVFDALREYQQIKKSQVTLEYVLLKGINDSPDDARRLAKFARSLQCKVNLIAYNPHPHSAFAAVEDPGIEAFRKAMLPSATHVTITVRWSKGRDIQAACGQLATQNEESPGRL